MTNNHNFALHIDFWLGLFLSLAMFRTGHFIIGINLAIIAGLIFRGLRNRPATSAAADAPRLPARPPERLQS